MTCPACGAVVGPEARFCASCGRALTVTDDERRVVTVVFADLVGYTALSERLDPEQVKNLVDRCFDRLASDVNEFGGRVDKIIGDAMVALFGAPMAHEDDAERAVRAALRMHQTLSTEADAIGAALQLRIGVNTGEVLVGAMHAAGSVTAMGDVVNTASRLQSAAEPGEVLVGPATHAATRQTVAYEDRGLIAAKGRDEPVETWRALTPLLPPGHRVGRRDVRLVGRDHEVGVLRHVVAGSVAHRRASVVVLLGDVGLGKSRLADEVAAWAVEEHGAVLREGRCVPYGEANVWWPVAESLRGGLDLSVGDDLERSRVAVRQTLERALGPVERAEADRLTQGLLTLLGHPPVGADPETVRQEAGRALGVYAAALASRRPLVIQFSDVHYADDVVLDLLEHVLEHVVHHPVVMLLTSRPGLMDRWRPTAGRFNSLVLSIDPLDQASTTALLAELTGHRPDPALAEEIFHRSGGNPFFVEELVALLDDGAEDDTGSVTTNRVEALPATLRGLVAARLDDLSPSARAIVQDASVIGQRGPMVGLRQMATHVHPHVDVDEALATLVADDLMALDGDLWSFRSDLVREVAYHALTKADRASRHVGIARYVELKYRVGDDTPGVVDMLAHHLGTAAALLDDLGGVGRVENLPPDLHQQARHWVVQAAQRTHRDQALPAARRLYDQAIDLLTADPSADPAEVLPLRLSRAEVAAESWELDAAQADIDVVEEWAQRSGDLQAAARALVVRGDIEHKRGDLEAATATLTRAVEAFTDLGDPAGRARALRQRAMAEIFGGRFDDAERSSLAALDGFAEVGDRAGRAWALQHLAWICFVTGRTDEADRHVQAALDSFTELDDRRGMSWAAGLLAWIRFQQDRLEEAGPLAEQVLAEARSRRDPWAIAMMLMLISSMRLWQGQTDEAVDLAAEAAGGFEALGDPSGGQQARAVLGRATVMAGRVEEGFRLLDDAGPVFGPSLTDEPEGRVLGVVLVATAVQVGEPDRVGRLSHVDQADLAVAAVADVTAALVRLQAGDLEAATDLLARYPHTASPSYLAARALVAAAAGDDEALVIAERLRTLSGATYLDRASAEAAAALRAAADGEHEASRRAALDHLDRLQRQIEPTGDRTARALAALTRARVLTRLDHPDAAAARDSAHEIVLELGIEPVGWDTVFDLALGVPAASAPHP